MVEIRQLAADEVKALFEEIEQQTARRADNLIQLSFTASGFEITPAHSLDHLRAVAEEGHARHGLSDDNVKEVTESCARIEAALAVLTADQLREIAESLRARRKEP